eukprot:3274702-Rhodomonas_salina.1
MRVQVKNGTVSMEHLLEGRADAFQTLHAHAVLGLVTGTSTLTSDSCPETLMLDLHRLQAAHTEFHFGVLGATALAHLHLQGDQELYKIVADFFS